MELVSNSCFTNKSAHRGLKTPVHPKEAREKLIDICGGYKVCWLALQLSTAAHAYPEELGGGCRQPIFKQSQKSPHRCGWVKACVHGCMVRSLNRRESARNVWCDVGAPKPKCCFLSNIEDMISFFKKKEKNNHSSPDSDSHPLLKRNSMTLSVKQRGLHVSPGSPFLWG